MPGWLLRIQQVGQLIVGEGIPGNGFCCRFRRKLIDEIPYQSPCQTRPSTAGTVDVPQVQTRIVAAKIDLYFLRARAAERLNLRDSKGLMPLASPTAAKNSSISSMVGSTSSHMS